MHFTTCTTQPKSPMGFESAFAAGPVTLSDVLAFHAARFGSLLMKKEGDGDGGGDGGQGAGDGGSGDGGTGKGGAGSGGDAGDESKLGDAGKKALESERAARKDAEKKAADIATAFEALKSGLKVGLGIDSKEDDPAAIVSGLQDQLSKLTHQNLVSDVARRNGITEDDDIELLRSATDKDVMEKLAARLKPAAEGEGAGGAGNGSNGKGRPKPDPSQGKGGGGAKPTSVAQVMADRAAARETKK